MNINNIVSNSFDDFTLAPIFIDPIPPSSPELGLNNNSQDDQDVHDAHDPNDVQNARDGHTARNARNAHNARDDQSDDDNAADSSEEEQMFNMVEDFDGNDDRELETVREFTYEGMIEFPAHFRKQTGMTRQEFDRCLWPLVGHVIPYDGAGQGPRNHLSRRTRLCLYLVWINQGLSYSQLAPLYHISASRIRAHILRLNNLLGPVLDSLLVWLSWNQQSAHLRDHPPHRFSMVVGVVDATVHQCGRKRGWNEQKVYYSGKHKLHCLKTELVVTPIDGLIISVSESFPGSIHDKRVWDAGTVKDKVRHHEVIMADSGYQGIHHDVRAILPKKKPRGGRLTNEDKNNNREISRRRVIVENAFARLKRYKILNVKWPGRLPRSIPEYNRMFRNVCALDNLLRRHRLDL